ncbi:MAG: BON domain-containing protein [Steroidobacteraceae bacterium]
MPALCRRAAFAGVLVTTLVLAAACASAPTPTRHDVAASNRVYAALRADPIYYFRHVNVEVDDGVANLSGYVWSSDAIYRARQIARGVPGVSGVVSSQLELEREGLTNGASR